jgi:hypothetical protein
MHCFAIIWPILKPCRERGECEPQVYEFRAGCRTGRAAFPRDKVRLIELLAPSIERDLLVGQPKARKSLFGLCSDLGPAPLSEDIDQVRRQEWAGFPKEEI